MASHPELTAAFRAAIDAFNAETTAGVTPERATRLIAQLTGILSNTVSRTVAHQALDGAIDRAATAGLDWLSKKIGK